MRWRFFLDCGGRAQRRRRFGLDACVWAIIIQSGVAVLFRFASEDSATALQIPLREPVPYCNPSYSCFLAQILNTRFAKDREARGDFFVIFVTFCSKKHSRLLAFIRGSRYWVAATLRCVLRGEKSAAAERSVDAALAWAAFRYVGFVLLSYLGRRGLDPRTQACNNGAMTKTNQPSYEPVRELLEKEKAHPLLIHQFERAFKQLYSGESEFVSGTDIEPVATLPALQDLSAYEAAGRHAMNEVAMIKLNGGLGTSMGLNRAKSLLPVKEGLSFLDIIARQVLHIREHFAVHTPLLFMNSFSTRDDTLAALDQYPDLAKGQRAIPPDFLQNRVPKIVADNGAPATHPDRPELAWCPPGHGDIYVCLQTTGLLDQLVDTGYHYAFVSNADNLGAVLDPRILGYMAEKRHPFLMEATARTAADRKGGHLALSRNGQLLLRESAQCPPDEKDEFQDIERYRYFNTNSLWINLPALRDQLKEHDGIMPLPVMINRKNLDPRDPQSPAVIQLETAMGAALAVIPGAVALDVPRTRFAPVKTTDDLLALRSDCFQINDAYHITPHPERSLPAIDVQLDPTYYRLIDEFDRRFPAGAPSLRACAAIRVEGDFRFGRQVICRGTVELINETDEQGVIPDNALLDGTQRIQRK